MTTVLIEWTLCRACARDGAQRPCPRCVVEHHCTSAPEHAGAHHDAGTRDDAPPQRPTYNHTRGDGPFDPCPECAASQTRDEAIALAADLRELLATRTAERDAAFFLAAGYGRLARVARRDHERSLAENDALRVSLRALVDGLPRCDDCVQPATRAWQRGGARYCDAHGPTAPEYPRAAALRAAVALLAALRGVA